MTVRFKELDVRPILNAGGEPFGEIMDAITRLAPDEGLKLRVTFEPVPLFKVLGAKGFSHRATELAAGDWEVLFEPSGSSGAAGQVPELPRGTDDDGPEPWPDPVQHLDNRDLDPPEPMVRILAALESLGSGEVLSALLCREPVFLLPELKKRGHRWRGSFDDDGTTYSILIRAAAIDVSGS